MKYLLLAIAILASTQAAAVSSGAEWACNMASQLVEDVVNAQRNGDSWKTISEPFKSDGGDVDDVGATVKAGFRGAAWYAYEVARDTNTPADEVSETYYRWCLDQ